jgi:hypothetical protein
MTIELPLEDLIEVSENAQRFGACVFKAHSTEGDAVWIAVTNPPKTTRTRRTRTATAESAASAAAQPAGAAPVPDNNAIAPNSGTTV